MAHMLNWPQEAGLLLLHPQDKFAKGDCIAIPPKKAAILEQDGAFEMTLEWLVRMKEILEAEE